MNNHDYDNFILFDINKISYELMTDDDYKNFI